MTNRSSFWYLASWRFFLHNHNSYTFSLSRLKLLKSCKTYLKNLISSILSQGHCRLDIFIGTLLPISLGKYKIAASHCGGFSFMLFIRERRQKAIFTLFMSFTKLANMNLNYYRSVLWFETINHSILIDDNCWDFIYDIFK